jgi:hypothetical protein
MAVRTAGADDSSPDRRFTGRTAVSAPHLAVESPRHERRDFIRAFHEYLWRSPGTDRPTVRPQTIVTVAALTAVGALVTGVVMHLIHPRSSDAFAAKPPPTVTTPTSYQKVSGWDCATAADHGFEIGGRSSAWYTVAGGGWGADGCHGSFEVVPMIAKAENAGSNQFALWWFQPIGSFDQCDLQVYVPRARAQDASAKAAAYQVLAGASGAPIGRFVVDQTSARGSWVSGGLYTSGQTGLAVRLDNATAGTDRLAVAQVRIHCGL